MNDPLAVLTELAELQAKCSPAPWELTEYRGSQGHDCIGVAGPALMCASVHREVARPDAAFIAAARNTGFAALREQMEASARQAAWLRERLLAIRAKIETIVCTQHPDDGVVLLSEYSPCHHVPGLGQVYDHEHFSPLGDALIELHEMTTLEAALTAAMGSERSKA